MIGTKPHPLYAKAAAGEWMTTAETARLIRDALACAFPTTRFYVRSKSYSGGSSIDIYYDGRVTFRCLNDHTSDGWRGACPTCDIRLRPVYPAGIPTREEVEAIAKPYGYSRFDGMIDLAHSARAWLTPDGRAFYGRSEGTAGSHGSDPGYDNPRPEPGAVLLWGGAGYVFVEPELPYDVRSKATR